MKKLERIDNLEIRQSLEDKYSEILSSSISEEVRDDLLSLFEETVDRHITIQESYKTSMKSLVKLDESQRRYEETLESIKSTLSKLNDDLTATKAVLSCRERIEA